MATWNIEELIDHSLFLGRDSTKMDEDGYANSELLDSTILIIFLINLCLIFLKSEKPQTSE